MKPYKNRVLWTLALILVLAISFGPAVLTAAWHIRHGRALVFEGRSIDVPLRWFSYIDFRTIHISKLSLTVFAKRPASVLVSLWPVAVSPKSDADRESAFQSFAAVYWTHLAGNDGRTKGPIRRGTGEKQAICMETSYREAARGTAISCLAYGGTWYATFYGDAKESDTFYKIIDDMR